MLRYFPSDYPSVNNNGANRFSSSRQLSQKADACQNEHHASCHAIRIDDSRACTVFKSLLTEVISPAHVNWIEPLTKTFCWHSECLNSKCEQQPGIFVLSKQSAAGISTLPKHNGMEIFRSKWRKRRTLTPDFLCDVIFFDLRRAARVIVLPNALSVVISKLCFYRMHSGIVWCAFSPWKWFSASLNCNQVAFYCDCTWLLWVRAPCMLLISHSMRHTPTCRPLKWCLQYNHPSTFFQRYTSVTLKV